MTTTANGDSTDTEAEPVAIEQPQSGDVRVYHRRYEPGYMALVFSRGFLSHVFFDRDRATVTAQAWTYYASIKA